MGAFGQAQKAPAAAVCVPAGGEANASYQIVIEGYSYRERLSPHRKLMGQREVIDLPTAI